MRRVIILAPLLFLPVIAYSLVAVWGGKAADQLQSALFGLPMISGGKWVFTLGDLILFIGLACLFVEIVKSASSKAGAMVNHALSMLLLVFCLIAFLLFPGFSTSVFFLLMIMALLDVMAGPVISIVAARRDFGVGENIIQ